MNTKRASAQLQSMADALAVQKGSLSFLALFRREGSLSEWDVVVSAPWLNASERDSYLLIAHQVHAVLGRADWLSIDRVVILESGAPDARALVDRFKDKLGLTDVPFTTAGGDVIAEAWVIVAQHPKRTPHPRPTPSKSVQAGEEVSFEFGEPETHGANVITSATSSGGVEPVDMKKSGIIPIPGIRKSTEGKSASQVEFKPSDDGPIFPVEARSSAASR